MNALSLLTDADVLAFLGVSDSTLRALLRRSRAAGIVAPCAGVRYRRRWRSYDAVWSWYAEVTAWRGSSDTEDAGGSAGRKAGAPGRAAASAPRPKQHERETSLRRRLRSVSLSSATGEPPHGGTP